MYVPPSRTVRPSFFTCIGLIAFVIVGIAAEFVYGWL